MGILSPLILGLVCFVGVTQGILEWEGATEGVCTDECDLHGETYYWCHKPSRPFHRTGWDYCSPRPGMAANGCKCTSKCDFGSTTTYRWCYTADNCQDEFYQCGPVRDLADPNAQPIYVYIDNPIPAPAPPVIEEEPF